MKFNIQFIKQMMGCAAVLLLVSNSALAQATAEKEAATAQDLPSAKEVIAEFIKATGGEEAHRSINTVVSEGTLTIPEANLEGEMTLTQGAPNKMNMTMNIAGIGETKAGYNGETAWRMSDMEGAQILEGSEAEQTKTQARINQFLDVDEMFTTIEVTGMEEFEGEDCYVVEGQKDDMDPMIFYFSTESKLMVGSQMTQVSQFGKMKITSKISKYKEVGESGVKMSHKMVAEINGMGQVMSQVVEMNSITVNGDVEDSAFALPDDVADLVDDDE